MGGGGGDGVLRGGRTSGTVGVSAGKQNRSMSNVMCSQG